MVKKSKSNNNTSNETITTSNNVNKNKGFNVINKNKLIENKQALVRTIPLNARRRHNQSEFLNDPFLVDYMKILESKAYRRLAYKTQVLSAPNNPHVRTRLVHTNEVISISVNIASQLNLNVSLCMAIAAGHDIGHTPYGHVGERIISELTNKNFKHSINSVVVAQKIERNSYGLNLTKATLEGIMYHSRGADALKTNNNLPPEYNVVMFADKIAYTLSDLNDAIRYGHIKKENLPKYVYELGRNRRERVITIISALVKESKKKKVISFSEGKVFKNFDNLKKFMFNNVYFKMDFSLQELILKKIYNFFKSNKSFEGIEPSLLLALLTDNEANQFGEILLKSKNPSICQIQNFSIIELISELKNKNIDLFKADLDW